MSIMTIVLIALLSVFLLLTTLTDIENKLLGKVIPLTLVLWGTLACIKGLGYMPKILMLLNKILS